MDINKRLPYTWLLFTIGLVAICTVQLFAQAAGDTTMTTELYYDTNIAANQAFWSMVVVAGMGVLKRAQNIGWISAFSWKVNRTLAVLAALLVSLGITYTYGYEAEAASGTVTLVFTGVAPAAIWAKVKLWVLSYGMQQLGYRATEAKA